MQDLCLRCSPTARSSDRSMRNEKIREKPLYLT